MLCRLFFQIYIKIKTEITDIDIAERQQEQIIKIKTDITDIDIAESKIQLISLQLNPREKEGTNRTQEREKEPTLLPLMATTQCVPSCPYCHWERSPHGRTQNQALLPLQES